MNSVASWSGRWRVRVNKRIVYLPLSAKRMWLDWDHGISILGHDMEVKNFYSNLLRSQEAPEVFFDVGANYGTHSLLFLCLGVPSVTFEPNSSCHPVFKEMCDLNHVTPDLQHVAIAALEGDLELKYPEKFTWLGSVKSDVCNELISSYKLVTEKVKAFPLDFYLSRIKGKKALIKVDTEGNELEVFKGASLILSEARPIVVFESNLNNLDRCEIADLLYYHGYEIFGLRIDASPIKLGKNEFHESKQTNFAAWPREKPILGFYNYQDCFY
jgi:FkbM family methyltransferase